MPAKLTNDEVNAFLDSHPGWITLTTIGRDGFPHSVPIGYFRIGDDVYIGCRGGSQKLKNIERNPRVCVVLESGSTMQDIKGVMIQGEGSVHSNDAEALRLARVQAQARGAPEAELPTEPRPGAAYIRVPRGKVISWDYSRG